MYKAQLACVAQHDQSVSLLRFWIGSSQSHHNAVGSRSREVHCSLLSNAARNYCVQMRDPHEWALRKVGREVGGDGIRLLTSLIRFWAYLRLLQVSVSEVYFR